MNTKHVILSLVFLGFLCTNSLWGQYEPLPFKHELKLGFNLRHVSYPAPLGGTLPNLQYRFYKDRWALRLNSSVQPALDFQTWSSAGTLNARTRSASVGMGFQHAFWRESFFRWVVPYAFSDLGFGISNTVYSLQEIEAPNWQMGANRERNLGVDLGLGLSSRVGRFVFSLESAFHLPFTQYSFLTQQLMANPPSNVNFPPPIEGRGFGRRARLYNVSIGFLF
jgi:hypothetical protein